MYIYEHGIILFIYKKLFDIFLITIIVKEEWYVIHSYLNNFNVHILYIVLKF